MMAPPSAPASSGIASTTPNTSTTIARNERMPPPLREKSRRPVHGDRGRVPKVPRDLGWSGNHLRPRAVDVAGARKAAVPVWNQRAEEACEAARDRVRARARGHGLHGIVGTRSRGPGPRGTDRPVGDVA